MTQITIEGNGGISAKIISDSVYEEKRLTTLQLRFHRFILPEFNTHRVFSRNASSSRAIPFAKLVEQIRNDPALPIHWGANQKGMQAEKECDNLVCVNSTGQERYLHRETYWRTIADYMAYAAENVSNAGYHKQIVNRLTEPFQFVNVIVTATEWENFFNLRVHKDAQPEINELGICIREAMEESTPIRRSNSQYDKYHLPYITEQGLLDIEDWIEQQFIDEDRVYDLIDTALKCSVARCARVSYLNHDKSKPNISVDLGLADMLLKAGHMSPFEHQGIVMSQPLFVDSDSDALKYLFNTDGVTHLDQNADYWSGNFNGWKQYRQIL